MKPLYFLIAILISTSTGAVGAPSKLLRSDYLVKRMLTDTIDPDERLGLIDSLEHLGYWKLEMNLYERARAYVMSGDMANAAKDYEKLRRISSIPRRGLVIATYWASYCHLKLGNYSSSLADAYELLELDKDNDTRDYDVEAYLLLASVYDRLGNNAMTAKCLNRAKRLIDAEVYTESELAELSGRFYLYRSAYYMSVGDYDKALTDNIKSRKFLKSEEDFRFNYMRLARLYEHAGDHKVAEEYYVNFLSYAKDSFKIMVNVPDAMYNYAHFLYDRGRYEESIRLLESFLKGKEADMSHITGAMYGILSRDYAAMGRYEDAYAALTRSESVLDSIKSASLSDAVMNVTRNYEEKLAAAELERHRRITHNSLQAIILLIILSSVLTTASVWLWRRFRRERITRAKVSSEKIKMESEFKKEMGRYRNDLNMSSRELVTISMQMAEKDSLIRRLKELSRDSSQTPRDILVAIRKEMLSYRDSGKTWDVFRLWFEKTRPDFFERLHAACPSLTPGETRMCAFIYMGLSNKEIAAMTDRSERAVESMKYRLRTRLSLSGDISTSAWLHTLMT